MEDRRKGDRRRLYGKSFLAMLIGGLPEDRRKGERRAATGASSTPGAQQSVETIRGDVSGAGGDDVRAAH